MIQEPTHAVTGIWDVVRELMPVLTFFLMGLATYVLNSLKNKQKDVATATAGLTESADRREAKLDQVVAVSAETHGLVNGQRTEMQAKIDALQAQLRAAGVEPQ